MLSASMLHAESTARLPCMGKMVGVTCDRCGRPGWLLQLGPLSGEAIITGERLPSADGALYAEVLSGPRAHRFGASRAPGIRPGAFILPADAPGREGYDERQKLVCIGRKHPRYERVVTREKIQRAYEDAVAAGRTSIRLSEIREKTPGQR